MSNEKVYLVGGAVRDLLMGNEPKDLDFVVVGSSPTEMLQLGFKQVGGSSGDSFPIFLHPTTGDEFALARTERKTGTGYNGFECEWEGVTLQDDLSRRDLTINAMALPVFGVFEQLKTGCGIGHDFTTERVKRDLVDPFNGQPDIKEKRLKDTSKAFSEDPLRVLRIGRFLARFGEEWSVSVPTAITCMKMVEGGDLSHLTPERVWKEMSRALMEPHPELFFNWLCLLEWDGVKELLALAKVEQRPDFHPEGDALVHTLLCLRAAAKMNLDPKIKLDLPCMFAVLCHDYGKRQAYDYNRAQGKTHLGGHEGMGLPLIEQFCERFKVPNDCKEMAIKVAHDHTHIHNLSKLRPITVARMFTRWNLIGKPTVAAKVMNCCIADSRGRGPTYEDYEHPSQLLLLSMAYSWVTKVDVEELQKKSKKPLEGKKLGEAVYRERVNRITQAKRAVLECDQEVKGD